MAAELKEVLDTCSCCVLGEAGSEQCCRRVDDSVEAARGVCAQVLADHHQGLHAPAAAAAPVPGEEAAKLAEPGAREEEKEEAWGEKGWGKGGFGRVPEDYPRGGAAPPQED
eukprot:1880108-Rhodomonas_salina.1